MNISIFQIASNQCRNFNSTLSNITLQRWPIQVNLPAIKAHLAFLAALIQRIEISLKKFQS
jgi:hypothetical protein